MANCLLLQNSDIDCRDIQAPKKIDLDKPKIVLGKGSPKLSVDVVLSALKCEKEIISRRHAEIIVLDSGECIINDLGALNGIFVNNVKVNSQKLSDGDLIQFGGICNQTVGTLLDKSDVSLRYMFYSLSQGSESKRKSPDSSLQSSAGKRSKAALDSLHNIVSPPLVNANKSPERDAENDKANLAKLKAELKVAQANFGAQIDRLKQDRQSAEASLLKEISTLKAQSAVQIEAIEKRDGIVKATKALCKQLEERTNTLQEQIAATERKLSDKAEQCTALQISLEAATAREKSTSAQSQCGVSSCTLMSSLSCPLCEEMLVEAVVLQCSHGFCRACIEQHWHATSGTKSSSNSSSSGSPGVVCKCPRCNAASTARAQAGKTSPRAGRFGYYVRSDHLDSLTWLLVEAGATAARQKYETREAQHRKMLQGLGIDPDLVPSNDPCDDEPATTCSSKKSSFDRALKHSSAEKSAFCDYCGGAGHAEEECPHRMDEGAESSSDEEESSGDINSDGDDM